MRIRQRRYEWIILSSTDWPRTGMKAADCSSRCHLCDKDQCANEARFDGGLCSSSDRLSHVRLYRPRRRSGVISLTLARAEIMATPLHPRRRGRKDGKSENEPAAGQSAGYEIRRVPAAALSEINVDYQQLRRISHARIVTCLLIARRRRRRRTSGMVQKPHWPPMRSTCVLHNRFTTGALSFTALPPLYTTTHGLEIATQQRGP